MRPAHSSGAASAASSGLVEREAVARVGHGVFGVAALDLVAGEARRVAQVLALTRAEAAMAAGPPQPGYADALARDEVGDACSAADHPADDLVTGDHRQHRIGQLAVDEVEVGAAHAAGFHPQQDLARGRGAAPADAPPAGPRRGVRDCIARMLAGKLCEGVRMGPGHAVRICQERRDDGALRLEYGPDLGYSLHKVSAGGTRHDDQEKGGRPPCSTSPKPVVPAVVFAWGLG